jgi:hypothetical protein
MFGELNLKLASPVSLVLALGCSLLAASRLDGQVGGNRSGGAQQPRIQPGDYTPQVQSPAEQVQDFTKGGKTPQPQFDSFPEPLSINPKDIHFPTPKIEFPPPADHSRDIGAIFSITTPVGILIAIIMMGLARRRKEQTAQRRGSAFSSGGPESHGLDHRGRAFVTLGADGKGGIMFRE